GDGRVPKQPCHECRGRGRLAARQELEVDIPAGIADGQRIRISGRGHEGEAAAPAGDLYVVVGVREDERFVREGDDLITALDVAAPLAALGATLEVPTLDGATSIELPAGTQPGEVLTVRGAGMPGLRRGRPGDLRVIVNVVIPRRLTAEQRELLDRLNETLTEENLRSLESMFAKLLDLTPNGVEEPQSHDDTVEYAVYGAPGELPSLPDLEAVVGEALVEISTSEVPDDWHERWTRFH